MRVNWIIIILILLLIIIILITKFKYLKKERYQPQNIQNISEDVLSYILVPNMTLQELNDFSITNIANYRAVNRYLYSQINLPLSTINKLRYFMYKGDNEYPFLNEEISQELNANLRQVSEFILTSLFHLFQILGAKYIKMIEFEGQNIILVDYSNLPVFESNIDFQNSQASSKMLINRYGIQINCNQEFYNLIEPFFINLIQTKLNLRQNNERFFDIIINVNNNTKIINLGFGYQLINKLGPNKGFNEILSKIMRRSRPEIDWLEDEMIE